MSRSVPGQQIRDEYPGRHGDCGRRGAEHEEHAHDERIGRYLFSDLNPGRYEVDAKVITTQANTPRQLRMALRLNL